MGRRLNVWDAGPKNGTTMNHCTKEVASTFDVCKRLQKHLVCAHVFFCLFIYFISKQTNRIARILAGSKKKICTKKPRFMSACAQLVIAFLLILLQLGIIVALLIIEPPQVHCAVA